ncbi:hypothetical protein ACQCX5_13470 [Propionibacteriaceae bacterium G57]|uniref:hypothetical protein n=1 Tax=Aestuariimicrobium sp. G57 TaxID=3418485 RepID=UPI003DA70D29
MTSITLPAVRIARAARRVRPWRRWWVAARRPSGWDRFDTVHGEAMGPVGAGAEQHRLYLQMR